MPDETTGSTVIRRQLGRELRRLRESAHLTVESAAGVLEWSRPKLWRIEKGAVALRSLDVEAMCRAYGADADTTAALMGLARKTRVKGWWQRYTDVIPGWFGVYLGLESAADTIHEYAPELVPGLLQTEPYARAMFRLPGGPVAEHAVERRVALRMERARLLTRGVPPPIRVSFVLNEAVLRRPVGDPALMAAQLAHVVQVGEMSHVDIRVLPFAAGVRRAQIAGRFAALTFTDEPAVVYSEALTGASYLDKTAEVALYHSAFDDLTAACLDPDTSRDLIARTAKDYHNG